MISWCWLKDLIGTGKREEIKDDYTERDGSGVSIGYKEPLDPDFLASDEEETMSIEPLDLAKVDFQASPNKSRRKGEAKYIVLHHTGPGKFQSIVNWLCNPEAKASAHYVVGTKGELTQLVNSKWESWNCGVAEWNGKRINNHHSIGIEICNIGVLEKQDDGFYYNDGRGVKKYTGSVEPKHGFIHYPNGLSVSGYYVPYPEKQINKIVALCKGLVKKYPAITKENILTHYQVALPIGRKNDPFSLDMEEIKNMIFGE